MKKSSVFLGVLLLISLLSNIYLFKLVVDWQDAWLEQLLITGDLERIYRKSGADISFDAIKVLVEKEFGEYEIVPVPDSDDLLVGVDKTAILVDGKMLYFKDGYYIGSKANLPKGLVHWMIGHEDAYEITPSDTRVCYAFCGAAALPV